jgi:5'-deoxynucleotidase YfbR-like HD superfamily hydrolase
MQAQSEQQHGANQEQVQDDLSTDETAFDEQQQQQQDLIEAKLINEIFSNDPYLLIRLLSKIEKQQQEKNLNSDNDVAELNQRGKRRVSVFNNIYHQCRIQKRKEKNLCLYLANLYQNLKGFHGL